MLTTNKENHFKRTQCSCIMNHKEFKKDPAFKCDSCHGLGDLFPRMDMSEETEQGLFHTYLEFATCGHKICYFCVEKRSKGHSIPLNKVKCSKCCDDKRYRREQSEKKTKYCHCPEEVEKMQEKKKRQEAEKEKRYARMTEEEKQMNAYSQSMNFMRIWGGCSGLPMLDDSSTCSKCHKEQYLYIGIEDNMTAVE